MQSHSTVPRHYINFDSHSNCLAENCSQHQDDIEPKIKARMVFSLHAFTKPLRSHPNIRFVPKADIPRALLLFKIKFAFPNSIYTHTDLIELKRIIFKSGFRFFCAALNEKNNYEDVVGFSVGAVAVAVCRIGYSGCTV